MSSAEKIAAAETEVEMVTDMFNRYAWFLVLEMRTMTMRLKKNKG